MRKLWLTFTAMLFCSIASFAQTIPIGSAEDFMKIGKVDTHPVRGSYELTANIDLGDLGTLTEAVIPTFEGTFNGNNNRITYNANFSGTGSVINFGLFGNVDGYQTNTSWFNPTYSTATIHHLNVQGTVTLNGTTDNMNVSLICGNLGSHGVIEYCNALGNINSTVNPEQGGGSDAGLIVGESAGTVKYCQGNGNVVGVGYVGGLIGQMTGSASVFACSFSGSVTALQPTSNNAASTGNFAGGICGQAFGQTELTNRTSIEFCVVNATINTENTDDGDAEGIICSAGLGSANGGRTPVHNCYGAGVVNDEDINHDDDLADHNNGSFSNLYYENEAIANCTKTNAECIADALNNNIPTSEQTKFYFDVINGDVVLIIGQRPNVQAICETPIEFRVTQEENQPFIISWTPVNDNTYYTESTFILTLSGGELEQSDEVILQNINYFSPGTTLPASENPYVFTIKTQCAEGVFSESQQVIFYVDPNCTANVNLSDATTTSATINWQGNVSTVKLGDETYNISEGVTEYTFNDLTPATTYTAEVIFNCIRHNEQNQEESYTKTLTIEFTTLASAFITKQTGDFNDANTWQGNNVPKGKIADIKIGEGHTVYVNHNLVITGSYKITDNQGVLQITQQGQLINNTTTDVPGIIEIVSAPKANQQWTFVGAPFDNYVLGCILPESHDVSVKKYSYEVGGWSDSWATIITPMNAGEGYFAYPFLDAPITFTTYGDVGTYEDRGNNGYASTETVTDLNISNVEVSLPSGCPNNWMALSNPYPAKLKVSKFLEENVSKLQGNCVYVFRDGSFDQGNISTGEIAMTEGFFVNLSSTGDKEIIFNKGQLSYNNPNSAKASANEFIKLTLINGNKKVRAYLAHNEDAEQGYDIFDANKRFAPTEIAEPYFITDGIALMKEEFAELPYYATMNVRSFADDTVSFVVNNIPEGLAVSIIDGENIIDMVEGGVYTTEILTGENADRFKVLIKKSVSISDVEELEVNITNNNRHISIATTETDLQVEVYNALGQKVLSTKDRNFTLNQVSAGAYLIKAFNNKASKTQKIVVE
ncbi:MAG: T9SS type A sorting domain-containing protein [Bacteroidales bacterium]|nr:T9SS type A sorting domain-containing protein [Bacteroidales bacterium]